ncbi:MAG: hypothetical protein MIO92_01300 [Methanosarcinaceae archaeon]|nr:hypothetical protein [Methanosarcinaceae archaeon]
MAVESISALTDPIKFIAEMYNEDQWNPQLAIADSMFSRVYSTFVFSIAAHLDDYENYWIAWGGTFDNPTFERLQIYMNRFLTQVYEESQLTAIENSFWVDTENELVYMHLDLHPWQYFSYQASIYGNFLSTFGTAPKDAGNPSDHYYGPDLVRPVMDIPSVNNSLNNIISGVITYKSTQLKIDNTDGHYDGINVISYFNTPLTIFKSSANAQLLSEFEQIYFGIITDIKINMKTMLIEAVDQFYEMKSEYCNKFSVDNYPNIDEDTINENIPVAWGPVYGIEPIEINRDTADPPEWIEYIAIDPDYIVSVQEVYDSDGNALTYGFTAGTGVIRVTELDGDGEVIEAAYMDVTGKSNNTIGEIIVDALEEGEGIEYESTYWDTDETDDYIDISNRIGFYFPGGTTRDLIEDVLKNDNAFLIQKNNGLLTLRQWGQEYETWQVETWAATKQPEKNFKDATKFYCSSVKVNYNYNHNADRYGNNYLDDSQESINIELYKKSFLAEFETCLISEDAAIDLAGRLSDRFAEPRETINIGLGIDTFQINPLDRVEIPLNINNRVFSEYSSFLVKKINPGQDMIEMEGWEKYYNFTLDDQLATLDGVDWKVSGDL